MLQDLPESEREQARRHFRAGIRKLTEMVIEILEEKQLEQESEESEEQPEHT